MTTRVRSITSPPLIGRQLNRYNCTTGNPNGSLDEVWFTYVNSGLSKTMVDTVTPDYHKIRKSGGVLPFNYLRIDEIEHSLDGEYLNQGTASPGNWSSWNEYRHEAASIARFYPPIVGSTPAWSIDPAPIAQKAVEKALAERNAGSSLALVTLAELGKTKRMIVERATRLATGLFAIASGKNKKTALAHFMGKSTHLDQLLKVYRREAMFLGKRKLNKQAIEEMWLELRYGWRPLVGDIEAGVSTILKLQDEANGRKSARARGRGEKIHSESTQSYVDGNANAPFVITMTRRATETVTATVTNLYSVDPLWEDANQWGLTRLPSTVYELIPLSFVLDWFVDVGGWIAANEPRPGVKDLGSCLVVRKEIVEEGFVSSIAYHPNHSHYHRNTMCNVRGTRTTRFVERTVGLPYYPFPRVGDFTAWAKDARLFDAIALFRVIGGFVKR